jgi:DNA polymerase-3 subunit delta'
MPELLSDNRILNIMKFSTIEGHEKPVTLLQRAIANNTLAHAYLFSGQAGIGKKMTAFALAAAVNCDESQPEGGCGVCPSCRRIAAFTHPDVHIVMPESQNEQLLAALSTKEAGKASNEIKIDQIRRAQERISLTPAAGSKKILIVDGAETLNITAQNAFLKTLEEPPGNALIILITAMPQSLLSTIRSRCQEITFRPLPRNTLARALMEKRGLTEEDAWFIAALAQGSMGRGLEMDSEQEKSSRDEVATLWSGLAQKGPGAALALSESISKDRERFDRLIDIGIEWFRDALVYRETGEERLLVHAQAQHRYRQLTEGASLPRLLADLDLFITSRNLLDRRVSAQLVADNLFLNFGRG